MMNCRITALAAAALGLAGPSSASAAETLSFSQTFNVANYVSYDQNRMFAPVYMTSDKLRDNLYSAFYEGTIEAPVTPTPIVLPGFDGSLGTLDSVRFSITSNRTITGGAFGGVPSNRGIIFEMGFDARIDTRARVGGMDIFAGSETAATRCNLNTLVRTGTDCLSIVPVTDTFNGVTTLGIGDFDAAAFTGGPITVDMLNTHVTHWKGFLEVADPSFLTSASSTLKWTGTVSVDYRYTAVASGAVPEPSTWLMLIAGFGAVGAAMRRRDALSNRLVRV